MNIIFFLYCPYCDLLFDLFDIAISSFESLHGGELTDDLISDLYDLTSHKESDCDYASSERPYILYESGIIFCENLLFTYETEQLDYLLSGELLFCYTTEDHYFYCPDCGCFLSFGVLVSESIPHTGDDCEVCLEFSGFAQPPSPLPTPDSSSGVLPSITTLVTAAIDWITAFVLCIITNPLLLIFVVSIFVILGLYLLKRSIRL